MWDNVFMALRPVEMVMTGKKLGHAHTWAYPYGRGNYFIIPTYELTVSGMSSSGRPEKRSFEVFRFGVQQKTPAASARVVGLAEHQRHVIKAWIPTYRVHSADSPENGAWQVLRNWLIHDGPDNPKSPAEVYASIGCIEICGGPQGFVKFNDFLIDLSGPASTSRDQKLAEIGAARNMAITFLPASRPPLVPR